MVHIVTPGTKSSSRYAEDNFKVLLSFVNPVGKLPACGGEDLLGADVDEEQNGDAEDRVRGRAAAVARNGMNSAPREA